MKLDPLFQAEIESTKYQYLRLLDLKLFADLGLCLTTGCTASYDDGNLSFEGRDAIVQFLANALGDPGIVTQHQVHHPEFVFHGDGSVRATWYLEDRVIVPASNIEIRGTALYHDRFVHQEGRWLIAHTGYERIYEEQRAFSTLQLLSWKSRFQGSEES